MLRKLRPSAITLLLFFYTQELELAYLLGVLFWILDSFFLYGGIKRYVKYVVSSNENFAVMRKHLAIIKFCGAIQNYVHVAVAMNHCAFIFDAIF